MMLRIYAVCFAMFVSPFVSTVFPVATLAHPSSQFTQVEPDFWRGSLPRERGLEQLKKMGVRTVVDLMDEDPKKWKEYATSLGMNYVNIPMRRSRQIPQESIKQFLDVVLDPANRPIYVHCRGGQDRTGAMIAIYRMQKNKWSASQAISEMRTLGFHPIFKRLSESVASFKPANTVIAAPAAGRSD